MNPADRAHFERLGIMRPGPHRTPPCPARHRRRPHTDPLPTILALCALLAAIAAVVIATDARTLATTLTGGAL